MDALHRVYDAAALCATAVGAFVSGGGEKRAFGFEFQFEDEPSTKRVVAQNVKAGGNNS